jgi:hypothetical protein
MWWRAGVVVVGARFASTRAVASDGANCASRARATCSRPRPGPTATATAGPECTFRARGGTCPLGAPRDVYAMRGPCGHALGTETRPRRPGAAPARPTARRTPALTALPLAAVAACADGAAPPAATNAPAAPSSPPAATCPPPPPHAAPSRDDVLGVIDEASSDASARLRALERLRHAPPTDVLDVLDAVVRSSTEGALARLRPDAVVDEVYVKAPRPARRTAGCLAGVYAARAARARTVSAGAATAGALEQVGEFLRARSVQPIVCMAVPCDAGETCVHPCCTGPCTPAPPFCVRPPAGRALCETLGGACPSCRERGADAFCACPPSP